MLVGTSWNPVSGHRHWKKMFHSISIYLCLILSTSIYFKYTLESPPTQQHLSSNEKSQRSLDVSLFWDPLSGFTWPELIDPTDPVDAIGLAIGWLISESWHWIRREMANLFTFFGLRISENSCHEFKNASFEKRFQNAGVTMPSTGRGTPFMAE